MTETPDIATLVRKCQSGDREALGLLYQTYLAPMRKVVSCYIKDTEEVWDILHDGFLIAFVSIPSLENASKVEAWLTSIMKNLALRYLKEKTVHDCVPISDEMEECDMTDTDEPGFSWEELSPILDKLPEGYGRIFRLAVLDGLSHKEIGEMLGIAPHSSSSQLARAKAMLRQLIRQYRIGAGLLSIAALIMMVGHFIPRHGDRRPEVPILGDNNGGNDEIWPDTPDKSVGHNGGNAGPGTIYKTLHPSERQRPEPVAEAAARKDSLPPAPKDSISGNDGKPIIPPAAGDHPTAYRETPLRPHGPDSDWSLSLVYSGIPGQNKLDRYSIPDQDLPSDGPGAEPEITERVHHKMPVTVGLSINRSLTPHWSIETGLRYSFTESAFLYESEQYGKRVDQHIHYIGIPLKLNYRIYSSKGFSLYGQGGGTLDIPVSGKQYIREFTIDMSSPETSQIRIHAPLQWSVEGGLGIQYHLTPSLGIFAEPSIHYYFNPGGGIRTIRQERPFEFSLPIGLRLAW